MPSTPLGLRIEVWDRDSRRGRRDTLMGVTYTDERGHFRASVTITSDIALGKGRHPDVYVSVKVPSLAGSWREVGRTDVRKNYDFKRPLEVALQMALRDYRPLLVVPRRMARGQAEIWIGWFVPARPPAIRVQVTAGTEQLRAIRIAAADWRAVGSGPDERCFFVSIPVAARPSARHTVDVTDERGGVQLGQAEFDGLPEAVPPARAARPFTILVGSCYFVHDDEGRTGQMYRHLWTTAYRPHVKLLLGDQVYLDHKGGENKKRDKLSDQLLATYRTTWTSGLRDVLERGAAWFTADDHEFWNNYPNPTAIHSNTMNRAFRDDWVRLGESLFSAIQGGVSRDTLDVGDLSIFVLECRRHRDRHSGRQNAPRFARDADMAALRRWVQGLRGPGVLAVGQPVITKPATNPTLIDANLANFDQYKELVHVLQQSPHDIVVVSGDVHFGGISETTLPGHGRRLIQVIASPMSLLPGSARFFSSPSHFPHDRFVAPRAPVSVHQFVRGRAGHPNGKPTAEHVATLSFRRNTGGQFDLEVVGWLIRERDPQGAPRVGMRYRTTLS